MICYSLPLCCLLLLLLLLLMMMMMTRWWQCLFRLPLSSSLLLLLLVVVVDCDNAVVCCDLCWWSMMTWCWCWCWYWTWCLLCCDWCGWKCAWWCWGCVVTVLALSAAALGGTSGNNLAWTRLVFDIDVTITSPATTESCELIFLYGLIEGEVCTNV